MPRGDGTGPMGMGAMTGRGAGWCAGVGAPGYTNSTPGQGFGRGRGFFGGSGGRGRRNMYYATGLPGRMRYGGYPAPNGYRPSYVNTDLEFEKQNLRCQADALQSELAFIRKRLDEIDTGGKAD